MLSFGGGKWMGGKINYADGGPVGIGPTASGDMYGKDLSAMQGTSGIGPWANGDTFARAVDASNLNQHGTSGEAQTDGGKSAKDDDSAPKQAPSDNAAFQGMRDLVGGISGSDAAKNAFGEVKSILPMMALSGGGETQKLIPGDHPQNDVVPAMLSPGEIVLPRSVTQSPEASEKAKAFVEAIKKEDSKKRKK
jgi:hypothetical protein